MDHEGCFNTAANMLAEATGCQLSVAAQIVEMIALGTIRWGDERAVEAAKAHFDT